MNFVRMNVIQFAVALWIVTVVNGVIVITLRYSKCNGHTMPFSDQGSAYNYMYTACNCTVTSHYTGELYVKTRTCENDITVMNITGTLFGSLCTNEISIYAYSGSELFLNFKHVNRAMDRSQNQKVSIFLKGPDAYRNGSFSVTCGSALRSITTPSKRHTSTTFSIKGEITTRSSALPYPKDTVDHLISKPAISDESTISDTVTHGHHSNPSKTKFPFMYVVAAGCIVVVAIIIIVFFCRRRKNRAQNTSKEERMEDRTYNNATIGIERPKNVEPSKQQQLPDNSLYHSYQINNDGGYSSRRNENIDHTEQLPDNPLYHSYQANGSKKDSKQNNGKNARTLPLQHNNAVYAQPNKLAKATNANQDDSNEGQNENVYARVNKTKKT